jgi:hypothetical protein
MMDFTTRVAECTVFSKIDLREGYLQIPMHRADIQKTAIIISFGLFKFLCLLFGLRNSGTFQRKMDWVTGYLDTSFTYHDDLMIFRRSLEDHELHLVEVFCHLQEHGSVINLKKCVFEASSIDFSATGCLQMGSAPC